MPTVSLLDLGKTTAKDGYSGDQGYSSQVLWTPKGEVITQVPYEHHDLGITSGQQVRNSLVFLSETGVGNKNDIWAVSDNASYNYEFTRINQDGNVTASFSENFGQDRSVMYCATFIESSGYHLFYIAIPSEGLFRLLDRSEKINHGGTTYSCIADHLSDSTNEPGVGASWATYWVTTVADADAPAWLDGGANYHNYGGTAKLVKLKYATGTDIDIADDIIEFHGYTVYSNISNRSIEWSSALSPRIFNGESSNLLESDDFPKRLVRLENEFAVVGEQSISFWYDDGVVPLRPNYNRNIQFGLRPESVGELASGGFAGITQENTIVIFSGKTANPAVFSLSYEQSANNPNSVFPDLESTRCTSFTEGGIEYLLLYGASGGTAHAAVPLLALQEELVSINPFWVNSSGTNSPLSAFARADAQGLFFPFYQEDFGSGSSSKFSVGIRRSSKGQHLLVDTTLVPPSCSINTISTDHTTEQRKFVSRIVVHAAKARPYTVSETGDDTVPTCSISFDGNSRDMSLIDQSNEDGFVFVLRNAGSYIKRGYTIKLDSSYPLAIKAIKEVIDDN